jgi:3-oxoacyl-[acyl-carrier protein] reductase
MDIDLKGKTALVSGASRGIGKSISLALAGCGAHVFLTARNRKKLQEVKNEIAQAGGSAHIVVADLSKEEDVYGLFKEVKDCSCGLDILINNAAIGVFKDIEEQTVQDFQNIFDVNVKSMFIACKEALKIMQDNAGGGYIINIASVAGKKVYPQQSVYAASKHAVVGLTKAVAVEKQNENIRVSVILPGGVDTDFIDQARPDLDKSILIRPDDIAKTVLYLLSLSGTAMVDEICVRRIGATPF